MTRIETDRLIIRAVLNEDAEPNARLWSDPVTMQFMGGPRDHALILRETPRIASLQAGQELGIWSVIEKTTDKLVGNCGLVQKEISGKDEHEIVYLFFSSAWGRGYATEAAGAVQEHALRRLRLPHVVALINPRNIASERVATRLGMHYSCDIARPEGETLRLYVSQSGTPTVAGTNTGASGVP